ncbi:MAG: hypothetical protein JW839_13420, partial [Candidatus Lokiarchaeota archaeon]|nr:hypothetical protein [Candidatus Lokiarchaeota archaeon]
RPKPAPSDQPAASQKAVAGKNAAIAEPAPTAKAVPFLPVTPVAKPAGSGKSGDAGAKLAGQLASISPGKAEKGDGEKREPADEMAGAGPAQKIKLNRNNLQMLIQVYRDEGYHAVSFSKFRREMGVGKDKEILKLKKLLLEAVAMGFLAKKGSKYIIQREGQEPLA